jgi:hypothetical protein
MSKPLFEVAEDGNAMTASLWRLLGQSKHGYMDERETARATGA